MPLKKKILEYTFLSFLILIPFNTTISAAQSPILLTVPFENIILNPNAVIQASYSFAGHPMIFCFDNTLQTLGNIQWPFQGIIQSSSLPIYLKIDPLYEGELADVTGTIKITNTTSTTIIMNCQYGF